MFSSMSFVVWHISLRSFFRGAFPLDNHLVRNLLDSLEFIPLAIHDYSFGFLLKAFHSLVNNPAFDHHEKQWCLLGFCWHEWLWEAGSPSSHVTSTAIYIVVLDIGLLMRIVLIYVCSHSWSCFYACCVFEKIERPGCLITLVAEHGLLYFS